MQRLCWDSFCLCSWIWFSSLAKLITGKKKKVKRGFFFPPSLQLKLDLATDHRTSWFNSSRKKTAFLCKVSFFLYQRKESSSPHYLSLPASNKVGPSFSVTLGWFALHQQKPPLFEGRKKQPGDTERCQQWVSFSGHLCSSGRLSFNFNGTIFLLWMATHTTQNPA